MEVYLNQPVNQTLKVRFNGVLIDADATPTATLTSQPFSGPDVDHALTVTRVSTGEYEAALLFADTAIERRLWVTWEYAVSGEIVQTASPVDIITEYNTLDELSSIAPQGSTDAEIREASEFARQLIEVETSRTFGSHYRRIRFLGSGRDTQTFLEPVLEIVSIESDETVLYDDTTEAISVYVTPSTMAITISDYYAFDYVYSHGVFKDNKYYNIYARFGYEAVPDDIKRAHKLLVNDWFCMDAISRKKYVIEQDAGDSRLKFDPRAFSGTGNFYVDNILQGYKRIVMVVI